MRINEITQGDKVWLKIADIEYDFRVDASMIMKRYQRVGKNIGNRSILKDDIVIELIKIEKFLNLEFDNNDPDIEFAKEIHQELVEIRDQL